MLNKTGAGILLLVGAILAYQSLKSESEQFDYALDSVGFLTKWKLKGDSSRACHREGTEGPYKDDGEILQVDEIVSLVEKGHTACVKDLMVGVPTGVARAIIEGVYVPSKATIPYELAKRALEEEGMRCSDYIKPLIHNCPKMLKPYIRDTTTKIPSKS